MQLGVHDVRNSSRTELVQVKRFVHFRKIERPPDLYMARNDIAVVELNRPVKFNDRIHPICLGAFQNEAKIRNFTVAGKLCLQLVHNSIL